MPRELVVAAWDEMFPDRKRRVIEPSVPISDGFVAVPLNKFDFCGHDWSETVDKALDRIARPLAEQFLVSPIAMRIRLEKLGLLHRTVPLQRLLSDGA